MAELPFTSLLCSFQVASLGVPGQNNQAIIKKINRVVHILHRYASYRNTLIRIEILYVMFIFFNQLKFL